MRKIKDKDDFKVTEEEIRKFAENYVDSNINKGYCLALKDDEIMINESIIPHLKKVANESLELVKEISSKNDGKQSKECISKLVKLYTDVRVYIAECNSYKAVTGSNVDGGTVKLLGKPYFHDYAFDNEGCYNIMGDGMPYRDILGFEASWKKSENKYLNEAFRLRSGMYHKLKEYNEYFDNLKKRIESFKDYGKLTQNLDAKVEKHIDNINQSIEKDYLKRAKKYIKDITRDVL